MGVDAELRYNCTQHQIFQASLHCFCQLCTQVGPSFWWHCFSCIATIYSRFNISFSDLEAEEHTLSIAQGPPREEISHSPHQPQSPLQPPARTLPSPQKFPRAATLPSTIISPHSSIPDEDYGDSNGAGPNVAFLPSEYPLFVPNYPGDETSYYHQSQEVFYHQYSDPEASQHPLLNPTMAHQRLYSSSSPHVPQQQPRPFSASSSSCSSSESEHLNVQNAGGQYYSENAHVNHFNLNCFNNNQIPTPHYAQLNSHLPASAASYTSVIVDNQQYQMPNEYVHWAAFSTAFRQEKMITVLQFLQFASNLFSIPEAWLVIKLEKTFEWSSQSDITNKYCDCSLTNWITKK